MYFSKGERMKKVLISIDPKWCEKIVSGEKTIEVRKSSPEKVPFKCYIYCTKEKSRNAMYRGYVINGKIIGEFICDEINEIIPDYQFGYENYLALCDTCLSVKEIQDYGKGKILDGWHISDLKIYDKPRELSEFRKPCHYGDMPCGVCENYSDYSGECRNIVTRPPQSWCYVEEL